MFILVFANSFNQIVSYLHNNVVLDPTIRVILANDVWAKVLNSGIVLTFVLFFQCLDTIPQHQLFSKSESYGMCGTTFSWIEAFFIKATSGSHSEILNYL